MVDNTTFMVYLKGADNVILPAFPPEVKWNSKKWRMLLHASEDDEIMFAGRQYPFSSMSGINTVLNIYNNLMAPARWNDGKYVKWQSNYITSYTSSSNPLVEMDLNTRYFPYYGYLVDIEEFVRAGRGALNYNDLLHSTCYTRPFFTHRQTWYVRSADSFRENPMIIGGKVPCLHCGEDYISDPETMRCNDCEMDYGYEENEAYGHCECCGNRIYYDDAYYVNDDYVCDYCFNKFCFVCDECGEAGYTDNMHCVEIDEDTVEYLCPHCYENRR
jgi:hypothetical protein